MKETFVVRIEEMPDVAERVKQILEEVKSSNASIVYLEGDLGAGKTTFTKELAYLYGVPKDSVQSPTFILKREYQTTSLHYKKIIHIDAYRFNTRDESKVLRIEDDIKDSTSLIAIEWPDHMKAVSPTVSLNLSVVDEDTREIVISY